MTKKILFLSIDTFFNVAGHPTLTKYYNEVAGARKFFEELGYTVNFNNPFQMRKQSIALKDFHGDSISEPDDIHLEEYSAVFCRIFPYHWKSCTGNHRLSVNTNDRIINLINRVAKSNLPIYNFCVDYRCGQAPNLDLDMRFKATYGDIKMYAALLSLFSNSQYRILVGSPTKPDSLIYPTAISNITDFTYEGLQRFPESATFEYDYIYGGNAKLTKGRKSELLKLPLQKKATVGSSSMPRWKSLSDSKSINNNKYYLELLNQSAVQIVFGEPWHDFVSLRFYEALFSSSLMLISKTNRGAVAKAESLGLSNRIIEDISLVEYQIESIKKETNYYRQQGCAIDRLSSSRPQAYLLDTK